MGIKRLVVAGALMGSACIVPVQIAQPAWAGDTTTIGDTPDNAAGSCYEIKLDRPTAATGVYWILTPKLPQPMQVYCDQTTNGGGWELIGKGRDGWVTDYDGKGTLSDLLTPGLATMSSTTTQLDSTTVNALMNGQNVESLPDGIRVHRAQDTTGTNWQEVYFKLSKFGPWSWTFGSEAPVTSYSFSGPVSGTSNGSGGTAAAFGSNTSWNRVTETTSSANTYKRGWAYGSQVNGSTSATSYLWNAKTNSGYAIPFADVYIRPTVLSTSAGFTAIPDGGTAGSSFPSVAKSKALASPWGVTGLAGTTSQEGDDEVQAFTQSGNTMYVGGNFKTVEQDASGTGAVNQSYLAAFDVSTGNFISSFTPVFNEQIHSLATLPNGDVVAGGEFTQVNGAPQAGVAVLNPTTGATDTSVRIALTSSVSGVLRVNGLTVGGGYLYMAGQFTNVSGGPKLPSMRSRGLARVSVTDGTPDKTWKPNLNGTATSVSLSPDGSRAYAVGYFTAMGSGAKAPKAIALSTASGAAQTPWTPTWSNSKNNYQHAVDAVGSKVWVGGSEHSLFQYDASTMAQTTGDIMKTHGDVQHIADSNGVVYAGCHCGDDIDYGNAYTWSTLNSSWTTPSSIHFVGAWSATTGARIPNFTPDLTSRSGEGVWAIAGDSTNVLWVGGDLQTVATSNKQAAFAGGFARFALNDSTAPTVPTNLTETSSTATTVTLSWGKSTDAGSGGTHYEVLRDDRPIAFTTDNTTTLTVPLGGNNRFFVRAIDNAGNWSASTPVLTAS
jgi:hypothetical protein